MDHGASRHYILSPIPLIPPLPFFPLSPSLLSSHGGKRARKIPRGKKYRRPSPFPVFDRTMYTAKTSPKYRTFTALDARRVRELSLHGHLAIYSHSPRTLFFFICLFPSTFPSFPLASHSHPPYFALIFFVRSAWPIFRPSLARGRQCVQFSPPSSFSLETRGR